jgi:3-oxoacyl-[acyl-carrier-protein] synthase-3
VVDTLARFGNTGAASVLLSLAVALDDGRVRAGDIVLLAAFGAGMSWGSVLLEWDRKGL